jgi:hypothetical protein
VDRDDDPNGFTLLEHLLLDSPHINQRLDAFYALKFNSNIWEEDTYFQKVAQKTKKAHTKAKNQEKVN